MNSACIDLIADSNSSLGTKIDILIPPVVCEIANTLLFFNELNQN